MNVRLTQAAQELDTAHKALRDAERENRRDKRPLPQHLYQRFREAIRLAEANLEQAAAAAGAMERFPPIRGMA